MELPPQGDKSGTQHPHIKSPEDPDMKNLWAHARSRRLPPFGLEPWAAALATPGLLITAVFLLKIMQNVFSGPLNGKWADFKDLSVGEQLLVAPAVALMFGLGVYPQFFIEMTNGTVMRIVEQLAK